MSFTDWPWKHWCARHPAKPAVRLNQEILSWQQLCQRVDALANGFQRQCIQEGDGVMLMAQNHPTTLLAWLALLQCGARILPVNPQLPRPLLNVLIPQMTLRFALVLDGEFDGLMPLAMQDVPGSHSVAWQPERLASMTLTSGSAGLPKAAVHTPAAHLASAEGVLLLMPYGAQDDWLLSLPLFHVSGQGILWRWLFAGARLTVRDKQPLEQMLQGCTHASLVPTQLWRLLNHSEPVALKAVLLGGAAIPVELTQRRKRKVFAAGVATVSPNLRRRSAQKRLTGNRMLAVHFLEGKSKLSTVKSGSKRRAWLAATGVTTTSSH